MDTIDRALRSTGIRDLVSREAALDPAGKRRILSDSGPGLGTWPDPVRRCVFNYSIIHPAIHHQPSVKFILFLCIGPLQFAAPYINLLLAAICLARAASNPIVPICRGAHLLGSLTRVRVLSRICFFFSRKLTRRNKKKTRKLALRTRIC